MQTILVAAIVVTLITSMLILLCRGGQRIEGPMPLSLLGFMALLFTSGLDVGLIMMPLTEFPVYARDPAYGFTNPLAIAFGFWGFLVWGFYFLTTYYFLVVEPRLRLFELPPVKFVNNLVIIGTCAFTAHLLWRNLPFYVPVIGAGARDAVVGLTVLMSVLTSTHIRYVRVLSVWSMWLFSALVAAMWLASGAGLDGLARSAVNIGSYFAHLPRFVVPITDYHAFYLFWWFSWSIMIGQFVSRFAGRMPAWRLAVALLVIPSIPIAAWFSVLYVYFRNQAPVPGVLTAAMVVTGILFVVNSLDSLIRLYSDNLGLTAQRLGTPLYVAGHSVLMSTLVLAFQFTPLRIEWIGLAVIGLYAAVYVLLLRRWRTLAGLPAPAGHTMDRMTRLTLLLALTLSPLAGACRSTPAATPPSADAWAVVDGREITREDVEKAYRRVAQGTPPSEDEAMAAKLNLLNELIVQDILLARAAALKIEVPTAELDAAYAEARKDIPEEAFQQELTRRNLTAADMREGLRRDMLAQKVIDREVGSKITVSDREIADFHAANRAQFNRAEDAYRIAQIVVTPVRDQGIANRTGDDAATPQAAAAKAQMLMERLKGGASFGDLAADFSEDPQSAPRGGDLGFVPVSALQKAPPALRDAVLKGTPGTVSVVSQGGAHTLVLLVAKEPAGQRDPSMPEVREAITSAIRSRKEQLLRTAYLSAVRNDAVVVNLLARRLVEAEGRLPTLAPAQPGVKP